VEKLSYQFISYYRANYVTMWQKQPGAETAFTVALNNKTKYIVEQQFDHRNS